MLFLFIAEIMPQIRAVMNHNWSFRHTHTRNSMSRDSVEMNRSRLKCFTHVVCQNVNLETNDIQCIHKKLLWKKMSLEEPLGVVQIGTVAASF